MAGPVEKEQVDLETEGTNGLKCVCVWIYCHRGAAGQAPAPVCRCSD